MRKIAILVGGLCLFLGFSSAWADATQESFMKSGGFQGMGAFEGDTVSRIQGVKMWESTATKFTGAILSRVAGGGEQIAITRIDKGVLWALDPKKKTYTESLIEPFKLGEMGDKEVGKEKPKVRVAKAEFTVKKTGASETINAFPCEEYLITWLVEMENLETKAKTRDTMTTNLWTTPETAAIKKLQAEQAAFSKAYMKKIGINLSRTEMKQFGMEAFTAMSGAPQKDMEKEFNRFKNEMAKIKGYPIRTVVNWKVEGEGMTAPKAEPSAPEESQGITGGIGGVFGGLKGAISKKLIGESKPAGEGPFFSSTVEVKAINTESIPADTFEVPSEYVKK